LYILEGDAQLDGVDIPAQHLVIPEAGARGRLRAKTPVKAMLFGGEPLDGPRHLVELRVQLEERIEQAKHDWEAGRFGTIPGDDKEFIRCRAVLNIACCTHPKVYAPGVDATVTR
jgi:hypothetical protein